MARRASTYYFLESETGHIFRFRREEKSFQGYVNFGRVRVSTSKMCWVETNLNTGAVEFCYMSGRFGVDSRPRFDNVEDICYKAARYGWKWLKDYKEEN